MICKWGSAVTKSGVLLFCCHQTSCHQGEFVASWTWVVGALCVVEFWWDSDVRADPAGLGPRLWEFPSCFFAALFQVGVLPAHLLLGSKIHFPKLVAGTGDIYLVLPSPPPLC